MTVHTQNKSALNTDLAEAHQPQCTRRPDQIHQKLLQLINGLTKTVELSEHTAARSDVVVRTSIMENFN